MIGHAFRGKVIRTGGTRVDLPIDVELFYDPERDPLAVRMVLDSGGESEVEWFFARDLLVGAHESTHSVGDGDIRFQMVGVIWPHSGLSVCLRNPTGHADLLLPHYDVKAFLDESAPWFRAAEEGLDDRMNAAIEEMLNG